MPHYTRQNPQPLSPTDWEKVEALEWPWHWRKVAPELLKKIRDGGPVSEAQVDKPEWRFRQVPAFINQRFRQAGFPYRLFKANYGGDTYTVGIVEPIKRKPKKLKKATLKLRAINDVIKVARAVARRSTHNNIAQLKKVLKNPNLPS